MCCCVAALWLCVWHRAAFFADVAAAGGVHVLHVCAACCQGCDALCVRVDQEGRHRTFSCRAVAAPLARDIRLLWAATKKARHGLLVALVAQATAFAPSLSLQMRWRMYFVGSACAGCHVSERIIPGLWQLQTPCLSWAQSSERVGSQAVTHRLLGVARAAAEAQRGTIRGRSACLALLLTERDQPPLIV